VIKVVLFVSSSTLWIYLWHIFFLFYWKTFVGASLDIANNFMTSFLAIAFLSLAATYIQKKTISTVIEKTRFGQTHWDILATLFLK
jgi:hypothetical protein